MKYVIALAALLSAAAAEAATTFNLECETVKFRINTATGQYCSDECAVILDIYAFDAESMIVSKDRTYTEQRYELPKYKTLFINRITGDLTTWVGDELSGQLENIDREKCKASAFTGFPKPLF